MLGNIATTAAGVVAGSFLFQGIQGHMGHHNPAQNALAAPPPDNTAYTETDRSAGRDDTMDVASADYPDAGGFDDSSDSA